nr:immunoglobulin light chain junction region [Macaca mulatta]MOV61016.1 immunoglobulin light chain junction region [Macaca mulatta]MOV61978.1 immunoglobulin light chain junction region [Macaca mulatta]MOV64304.1 immunoglobulin light chain junction region [Macaca mulatta]MOV64312.1 immunoglobulin light chain junction region [Macaca mulatta]
CQQHNTYPWTF